MTVRFPKLVLCDLDGTLVDSVPDLGYAVDEMMTQLALPKRGTEQVRHWVGNGMERLIKRALVGQLEGEPTTALYQQALPLFQAAYAICNGRHSVVYPGVQVGLTWLKSQAFPLACITNKPQQFTLPLLKMLALEDFFRLVISGDTLPQKKPDPLPLLHAAEFFGVEPTQALMIGDSINDVQAARAAGFQVICVSYGYNHGQDIRLAHPEAVIDSLTELPLLLKNG
jgi:phosphoglycolate phosphatase